jgi:hypothetical protein
MAAEAPQGKETASGAEQGREDVKRPDSGQGAQADEKTEPKKEPDNARISVVEVLDEPGCGGTGRLLAVCASGRTGPLRVWYW